MSDEGSQYDFQVGSPLFCALAIAVPAFLEPIAENISRTFTSDDYLRMLGNSVAHRHSIALDIAGRVSLISDPRGLSLDLFDDEIASDIARMLAEPTSLPFHRLLAQIIGAAPSPLELARYSTEPRVLAELAGRIPGRAYGGEHLRGAAIHRQQIIIAFQDRTAFDLHRMPVEFLLQLEKSPEKVLDYLAAAAAARETPK